MWLKQQKNLFVLYSWNIAEILVKKYWGNNLYIRSSSQEISIFNAVTNIDNQRTADKRPERIEGNRGREIDLSLSQLSLPLFLGMIINRHETAASPRLPIFSSSKLIIDLVN